MKQNESDTDRRGNTLPYKELGSSSPVPGKESGFRVFRDGSYSQMSQELSRSPEG